MLVTAEGRLVTVVFFNHWLRWIQMDTRLVTVATDGYKVVTVDTERYKAGDRGKASDSGYR